MATSNSRKRVRNRLETSEEKAAKPQSATDLVHSPEVLKLSSLMTPPKRGTKELLSLFSNSPWLRAIVGKISRSVAEVHWQLYAKPNKSGSGFKDTGDISHRHIDDIHKIISRELPSGELTEITSHPLLDLLRRGTGNARLNGFGVFQISQSHLDLVGEAHWLFEKNKLGVPETIWPIPPHWVQELPTQKSPFYKLSIPGGSTVGIPVTEMFSFIDPNPENPYQRGTGIAGSLNDELQIDEYAAQHQKGFFLNRARPDVIISGQFMSKSDAARLESQWLSNHQGFMKAFKPLFFSQKIDVTELTQSFESIQMTQIRKYERDTFINVFGSPPEKFGLIGESKRSTIQAADYFWNKDLIKPRMETMRRVLQEILVPMYDERLLLSYETPVIQDEEFLLKQVHEAPWSKTLNEYRKDRGEPRLPGYLGDCVAVPYNLRLVPLVDNNGNPLSLDEFFELQKLDSEKSEQATEEADKQVLIDSLSRTITDNLLSSVDDIKKMIESNKS